MNMIFERKLAIPMEVKEMYPLTGEMSEIVQTRDAEMKAILSGASDKMLMIVGPCSADNEESVIDYIHRLRSLTEDNIYPDCDPLSNKPKSIPNEEMELFRFIARTAAREVELIDYEPQMGDRVRITGGVFEGAEGYIRRVHGTKRFVVCIEGVAAIATTYIPRQYIEKLG